MLVNKGPATAIGLASHRPTTSAPQLAEVGDGSSSRAVGGIGVSAAAQIALDVAALSPAEARQEATRRMSPMLEGLRKCLTDEGRDQDRRAAAIA